MSGARDSVFDPQQLYDDVAYTPVEHNHSQNALSPTPLIRGTSDGSRSSDKFSASDSNIKEYTSRTSSTAFRSVQEAPSRWTPHLLRPFPTGLFALVILLLIIGLELFYRNSPYNAPSSGGQFMWTYAPVALLMVVQWIWTAYDLRVKLLVPWAAMSRRPVPAREGWLLDYIGINSGVALWTALKYRHFVVLLAQLGLWSTALAGIVTTSLFKIEDNVYSAHTSFNLTTQLDRSLLSNFDPSILSDKNYLNSYLGRQALNLSRPRWTTSDNIVIEAFDTSSAQPTASALVAQTTGYSATLGCTKAIASYAGNESITANTGIPGLPSVAWFVNVDAGGCQERYRLTDSNIFVLCGGDPCYTGRVYNHTCPGQSTYSTVLVLAAIHNFAFISASAVECSPSYSQYLLDVTSSSASVKASMVSQSVDSSMTADWSGMLQWINTTEGGQRYATGGVSSALESDLFGAWGDAALDGCDCDPWFFLIDHAQNVSAPELMNTDTLINASTTIFAGLFADIAQSLFMTAAPASAALLPGSVQTTTRQLVATETSVRVAQAALSVLLAVVVGVYLLRPQANLPINPASMAAQAFLLKSNHKKISAIIKDTATLTTAETLILMEDWSFEVQNDRYFRIHAQRTGTLPQAAPKFVKAPVWRPYILHPIFKILLCLLILAPIIALELALRQSQRDRGFTDFVPSTQDGWQYIAPTYLFFLGIFLSSYTFSVSTLEPFFAMHGRPQSVRQSVRYSPATQTNAGLAWHAFRYRSLVGMSCAAIMLIVPFIKIVVSGLIISANEPAQTDVWLLPTTTFNLTSILPPVEFPSSSYIQLPGEIFALSQIPKYGLTLPPWTTNYGAVAGVDEVRLTQLVVAPNSTLELPLEVMHADLGTCYQITGSDLVVVPPSTLQLPLPTSTNGAESCFPQTHELVVMKLPTAPGWFGQLSPIGCGGYTFIYGSTDSTNASAIQDLTVVQCTSYNLSTAIQNVTFAYEQNTVKVLSVDTDSPTQRSFMSSFPFNESGHLGSSLPDPTFEANSSLSFDTFFQIMTLQNTSTPLATFLDPEKLIAAAQTLYTTYWAIHASLYERIPLLEAAQQPRPATLNYQNPRIIQAEAPTRILQALLACILLCGLMTVVAVRKTNNVLTKPPYSIGATMGLLADSKFVELPELGGVRTEKDLERVLEPYEFQLGWGNNSKGGVRFGVDIVKG